MYSSIRKPKVTRLNVITYSSRLTSKRGQGGKMIDAAIADNKLHYESQHDFIILATFTYQKVIILNNFRIQ